MNYKFPYWVNGGLFFVLLFLFYVFVSAIFLCLAGAFGLACSGTEMLLILQNIKLFSVLAGIIGSFAIGAVLGLYYGRLKKRQVATKQAAVTKKPARKKTRK